MRIPLPPHHHLGQLMCILLSLALAACGPGAEATPAAATGAPAADGGAVPDLPAVIATVNGASISSEAFERELARFQAGQAALGLTVSDEAAYRQQVLDLLIERELIRQYAAQQGIVISEDDVTAEINSMIAEQGEEYFNGWLAGNYYTLDEFRDIIKVDLMWRALREPIIAGVPETGDHVHARHILVDSEEEADAVVQRLQNGEDFAALAAEYSVDVTTRDSGGDLGWFARGVLLVPEVEEVAFSQQPGQISGVVPSAWGYHIVQTLEFDSTRSVDPETRQRLIESTIEAWQQGLRANATVEQFVTF